MSSQKPKASSTSKDKPKKASEISDAELRSVTGGMASTGGTTTKPVPPVCVSISG